MVIKRPLRLVGYETLSTLALLIVGVISSLVLITLPVLVAGMVGQFGWGDREVGWLASVDMAGSAAASLCVLRLISRINWRKWIYRAIAFVILGNIASIFADSFTLLLAVRFTTGFSNGVILAITFTGLLHSSNPDRFFGAYTFGQLTLQALLLATLPLILSVHGMPSIYLILAGASAASAILVRFIPENGLQKSTAGQHTLGGAGTGLAGTPRERPNRKWMILALAAQGIYFLAPAAIWGYFESIGDGFGLSIAQVGSALATAAFAGIAGSFLVIALGVRIDRMLCMAFGTIVSIAAVLLLINGSGFVGYLIAGSLFTFAWNYTFPYQMGVLSLFDKGGTVAIISLVVQLFGLAAGPVLASLLLFGGGYSVILMSCVGCYLVSLILFFASAATPWEM